jgi:hypothetical protein
MTDHTGQTTGQAGAAPARIELEDFIEAVTRGVARALAAQDDVGGYALRGQTGAPGSIRSVPTIMVGIFPPPTGPRDPGDFGDLGSQAPQAR